MEKKYKFKRFADDLNEALKDKDFKLMYEIETVKLKMAEKLAELREKMGLTHAKLAKKMRVSQQLISRIESGSDNITILSELLEIFEELSDQTLIQQVMQGRQEYRKGGQVIPVSRLFNQIRKSRHE